MQNSKTRLLDEVATYYAGKLAEHGDTPHGADWIWHDQWYLYCASLPNPVMSHRFMTIIFMSSQFL